jgi:hypothetical protein
MLNNNFSFNYGPGCSNFNSGKEKIYYFVEIRLNFITLAGKCYAITLFGGDYFDKSE